MCPAEIRQHSTLDGIPTLIEDANPEYTLAVSWDHGYLAAAFYRIDTMELFVTQETIDIKPNFYFLNNLLRQISPKTVIGSGPNIFLKEVMRLMEFSENEEPQKYRLYRNKSVTASNFVVYTNDLKSLAICRNRIMSLRFPGISRNASDLDVQTFIESVLPLDKNLVVFSLGNLLNFLDSNWRHLYLRDENSPIITDLKVFYLQSQVLIDETTFNALQIFNSSEYHPSAFKCGAAGHSHEGPSLYSLLNKCCSRNGSSTMKMLLQQPIRDILELNLRYATVEWCLKSRNSQSIIKIQRNLRRINNVSVLYARLVHNPQDASLWKQFRETVYYAYITCELCAELNKSGETASILYDLAQAVNQPYTLKEVLILIDTIVDIEEGLKCKRFVMKRDIDVELDTMKDELNAIQTKMELVADIEINLLPASISQVYIHFIPEIGFLLSVTATTSEDAELHPLQNDLMEFVFKAGNTFYYKTEVCAQLNEKYGNLYPEISAKEKNTCERLIKYIREALADIQVIVKLCAKFDCLMAMASVASQYKFVKPQITTENSLRIVNGRHVLFETRGKFIPNDTDISADKKNIVTILNAPNASGKSVYLKQIGLIAIMAHIGSFVPADSAQVPLLDSIYSRIYSSEATYKATSSFLADLQQMSQVMMSSTDRSLVLVDEFGKGTNVEEGRALLTACLDSLLAREDLTPITIVSIHDPGIHDKLKHKDRAALYTFQMESGPNERLIPLYKIMPGKCAPNYATSVPELKDFFKQLMNETFKVGNVQLNVTETCNRTIQMCDIYVRTALIVLHLYAENGSQDVTNKIKDIFQSLSLE